MRRRKHRDNRGFPPDETKPDERRQAMKSEMLRSLVAMLVTQAAVVMAAFTAPVLAKQIAGALQMPAALIGYYTSIVFAGAMAASLISGPLIQRYGAVRVSQGTVLLAALGLVSLAAGHPAGVVTSAILAGLAYAPGNPASSQLLAQTTPPQHRNAIFSLKQTAVPIGVTITGFATPFLLQFLPWQAALLVLAGLCIGVVAAVEPWRPSLDARGPTEAVRFSPFAALRLVFAVPVLRRLGIVSLALASVQFGFSAIFATYLQEAQHISTGSAGLLLSAAMVTSVILRVALGATADRFGARQILIGMTLIMVVFAALLTFLAAPLPAVAITGVVLGAASFSWNGVYLAEVADAAPKEFVASATAGTMFFVFLGGFIGPGLVSTAISLSGAYEAGFAVLSVIAALGATALLLPERSFAAAPRTSSPQG
ncbi:MAG: MFS transporter [Rhodomicrobiaceae bacterium]